MAALRKLRELPLLAVSRLISDVAVRPTPATRSAGKRTVACRGMCHMVHAMRPVCVPADLRLGSGISHYGVTPRHTARGDRCRRVTPPTTSPVGAELCWRGISYYFRREK